MPTIRSENLNQKVKEQPETKGWIVGHFMGSDSFFKTDALEVKWAIHLKGDIKPGAIYVAYDASEVLHTAESLEDSTVLAIRWPSNS